MAVHSPQIDCGSNNGAEAKALSEAHPRAVAMPVLLQELQGGGKKGSQLTECPTGANTSNSTPAVATTSSSATSSEELRQVRKDLLEETSRGSVEERILGQLITDELDVLAPLQDAKSQLAHRMLELVLENNMHAAMLVARVLRSAVGISTALKKRIQSCTDSLANRRIQRHLLVIHKEAPDGD